MTNRSVYEFTIEDIHEVIQFCRDYHLDPTKPSTGRTGSGPRGLGGEIDAFGPGKLNEIAVSRILSTGNEKICLVDNKIYSNHQVGIETIPDIVAVKESEALTRRPRLYVEVKKISESDQWLGIHSDQLKSILRNTNTEPQDVLLVFGEIFFQDDKTKKQQDFLGAFLNSILVASKVRFDKFSNLSDLRCKIHYVLSVQELQKHGHEFEEGDIIPELDFKMAKRVFRSDGTLMKGLEIIETLPGKGRLCAVGIDGKKYSYGDFLAQGKAELIAKVGTSRRYLRVQEDTTLENDYFGKLEIPKGKVIFFNLRNKLAGMQGAKVKTKSDWWISRNKLNQLIATGTIPPIDDLITKMRKDI